MKSVEASLSLLFILTTLSCPLALKAEMPKNSTSAKIYKWTDQNGKVHFSTTPSSKKAKTAPLPEIKKENYEKKIGKIKSNTPKNCSTHNGIDCEAGPDSDGSVICNDGYRNAVLPFRFKCLEAKLKVASLEVEQKQINLTLRNNSPVAAKAVRISISNNKFRRKQRKGLFQAEGPREVEPWSVAEYTMPLPPLPDFGNGISYRIRCENCNGVTRSLKNDY